MGSSLGSLFGLFGADMFFGVYLWEPLRCDSWNILSFYTYLRGLYVLLPYLADEFFFVPLQET